MLYGKNVFLLPGLLPLGPIADKEKIIIIRN